MEGEQGSLNGRREVIRGELRRNVMGQLKDQIYLEDEQLYEQIDTAIRQKGKETYLPLKERLWLRNSLYDSFRRLDILQELLDDKDVTEIMINGAGKIFIKKGDIYYADLMPVIGSEQGGIRPVLIIQNDVGNCYSPTVIVAAITSRPNKHWIPTHIELGNHVRGLHNDSVILLEQVRTIDRIRLRGYVGSLSGAMMRKVDEAILVSFGVTVQRRT